MSAIRTLWLIPARGGSKGIPNKNIKLFCGKSLVKRAVEQALQLAGENDMVFVSTDSPIIKEEVETTGVKIPFFRPSHLSTDTASTYSVIRHVLDQLEIAGENFDRVILLQPTSPLRHLNDIKGASELWTPEIDMVVSVCEAKANPYFNAFEKNQEGYLHISKGDGKYVRRQDAPKVWEYNGAVYVMSVPALLKGPISSFTKIVPFEMDSSRSVDLDTPQDWMLAEYLYSQSNKN